jgi:hypothetical protein
MMHDASYLLRAADLCRCTHGLPCPADPKVTEGAKPNLKRLNSGEQWDNSSSFYSDWR